MLIGLPLKTFRPDLIRAVGFRSNIGERLARRGSSDLTVDGGDASGGFLLQRKQRRGGAFRRGMVAGLAGGATYRWNPVGAWRNGTRQSRGDSRTGRLRAGITG